MLYSLVQKSAIFINNSLIQTMMAEEKESKKPIINKKAPLIKKKKLWFQILGAEIFGRAVIGETLVEDSKHLAGKTIQLSLMSLTGDMKKQNINIKFVVEKIVDGKGLSRIVAYELAPTSIKRMVRRGRMRVDASFVCQTKDCVKLRVKPFLLTTYETKRSIIAAVRKQVIAFMATYIAKQDYDAVFKDVVSGKLQAYVREAVRYIYPIRTSEMRMLTVVKDTVPVTALPNPNIDVEKVIEAAAGARQQRQQYRKPLAREEAPAEQAHVRQAAAVQ